METGPDYKRSKNHVYENGTPVFFLDSVYFLSFSLCRLPEAFGLTVAKSLYPHYFNNEEDLDYIGSLRDVSYYRVNEMGEEEMSEFLECYEMQEPPFDNRSVLEQNCQNDVKVLRRPAECFDENSCK